MCNEHINYYLTYQSKGTCIIHPLCEECFSECLDIVNVIPNYQKVNSAGDRTTLYAVSTNKRKYSLEKVSVLPKYDNNKGPSYKVSFLSGRSHLDDDDEEIVFRFTAPLQKGSSIKEDKKGKQKIDPDEDEEYTSDFESDFEDEEDSEYEEKPETENVQKQGLNIRNIKLFLSTYVSFATFMYFVRCIFINEDPEGIIDFILSPFFFIIESLFPSAIDIVYELKAAISDDIKRALDSVYRRFNLKIPRKVLLVIISCILFALCLFWLSKITLKQSKANKAKLLRCKLNYKQGREPKAKRGGKLKRAPKSNHSPYPDDQALELSAKQLASYLANNKDKLSKSFMNRGGKYISHYDFYNDLLSKKKEEEVYNRALDEATRSSYAEPFSIDAPSSVNDWFDEEEEELLDQEINRLQNKHLRALEREIANLKRRTKASIVRGRKKMSHANRRVDQEDRVRYASGKQNKTKPSKVEKDKDLNIVQVKYRPRKKKCYGKSNGLYIFAKDGSHFEMKGGRRIACNHKQAKIPGNNPIQIEPCFGLMETENGVMAQAPFVGNYTLLSEHTVGDSESVKLTYKNRSNNILSTTIKKCNKKPIIMKDAVGKTEKVYFFNKPQQVKSFVPSVVPSGLFITIPYAQSRDDFSAGFHMSTAQYDGKGYNCSTFPGVSNAPILYGVNDTTYCAGIHNMTDGNKNYGLMFTTKIIAEHFR
jgi:hypothetical protein